MKTSTKLQPVRLPPWRGRGPGKRGRPELIGSYEEDMALLNTPTKRRSTTVAVLIAFLLPFILTDEILFRFAAMFIAAIGAIGLNIVTGYAGQVSLGHAFFLGLGAYTAAIVNGEPGSNVVGLGLGMEVWLPAAGIVAALAGLIVSPIAFRLRGLYLAVVTLGLVFIGEHIFREAESLTGGVGVGRPSAFPVFFGFNFETPGTLFGTVLTRSQGLYLMGLIFLVIFAVLARNLARSAVGRAFAAVRDRDIAAEVMGVSLRKYKVLAFTISSFYAGIAGALLYTLTGFLEPGSFDLLLSVQYIAMVLIGGVATISGSIMGAAFITLLPRMVQEFPRFIPFVSGGQAGGLVTTQQLEQILYGLLIVAFLIFEPRGLYGVWVRIRNYWRAWPFSY
ncbi:MAG TPA: branched-chain amino acid ABC transporter permease [Actinomycetota bacterium]|nr:branched-chain amino acid ABC transporter permease [Actinomycetota bacterium]